MAVLHKQFYRCLAVPYIVRKPALYETATPACMQAEVGVQATLDAKRRTRHKIEPPLDAEDTRPARHVLLALHDAGQTPKTCHKAEISAKQGWSSTVLHRGRSGKPCTKDHLMYRPHDTAKHPSTTQRIREAIDLTRAPRSASGQLAQALLFLSLFCSTPTDAFAATRWYLVELIAFEHQATPTDVSFLREGQPRFPQAAEAVALRDAADSAGGPSVDRLRAYQVHAGKHLQTAHRRLSSHPSYRVLLYRGWLLPAIDSRKPVWIGMRPEEQAAFTNGEPTSLQPVAKLGSLDQKPEIQGFVVTKIGRYLDVEVDFVWFPNHRDNSQQANIGGYARIIQSRRIQLDQAHYFDHPLFGVLLKISRMDMGNEATR